MSTENEGTEGIAQPAAPSAPPVPAAAPDGAPAAPQPMAHAPAPAGQGPAAGQAPYPVPGQSPSGEIPPGQIPSGEVPPPQQPVPGHPGAPGHPQGGTGWPPPPPTLPVYGGGGAYGGGEPVWGAPVPAPAPRRRSGVLIAAVLISALVAGGVGGGLGYWQANRSDSTSSTTVAAAELPKDLKREPGTVSAVAAQALPSVVTIQAASASARTDGGFGEPGGRAPGGGGTGTGFVYDKEGHILTNNHVVASAADGGTLSVTFSDNKSFEAEVVGRAEGYDVAVLKLKSAPSGLAPLPLGNSDRVAVGDSTIAIGAPFGLSNTVTTGIISAKSRPVASGDGSGAGNQSYMSALQTDASINPGNSGGPLLDARGAVIGINSAIQSTAGPGQSQAGSIGLGFAIPINQAKNVAEQLIKTGEPVYPVIGATVNMVDKGTGAEITSQGVDGTAIVPNGPADKAGLEENDVITRFNDSRSTAAPP